MRFVLLVVLMLVLAFATKERARRRRADLVPHGYPDLPPVVAFEPGEVVTVARLPRSEVAVAQGLLSSAGIPSYVHPPDPALRMLHKPVQLRVRAADEQDARALLGDVRGERPEQAPE